MNIEVVLKNFINCLGNNKQERYFTFALMVFIFSYLVLPTTKMVNNFYYIFLALPAFICLVISKKIYFDKKPTFIFFMAFLGWMMVSGAMSGDFQFFRHVVYVLLFMVVLMAFVNPAPFHDGRFCRFLFWSVCIYIVGSALIYWTFGVYHIGERVIWLPARMTGPIYSSMWVAACLSLAAPIWLRERRWFEGGMALLLALISVTFVLQSRSGLLGIILLLVVLFLDSLSGRTGRSSFLIVMLSMLGVVLWFFRQVPGVNRMFSGGISPRLEIWSNVIEDWVNCGLFLGCGIDHKLEILLKDGRIIQHPHNIYLSMGVYAGLISLMLFLFWIVSVLLRASKQRNQWGLYLILSLFMLCFDGSLIIESPDELWLLVFLPAGLISCRDNQT